MLRLFFLVAAIIGCIGLSGCDFSDVKRPIAGNVGGVDIDPGTTTSGNDNNTGVTPTQTPPAPPPPAEIHRPMEVGASQFQKGQYGKTSIINYNATSFFRTRERISIMMIDKNMDLYKAGHNNQVPKTYEEYQREVLPGIKLPELRDGCRYEYDPETGELNIVHPADMKP